MREDNRERSPRWPRLPLLATLMEQPVAIRILGLLLLLHFGLMGAGLTGWTCPSYSVLHLHCPGCGLSRSIMALSQGNLAAGLELHLFGPLAGLTVVLLLLSCLLPAEPRRRLVSSVRSVEVTTGLSQVCLLLFMLYWLIRLIVGHGVVRALV
jgi:hypothetical protein